MYIPKPFAETDLPILHGLIRDNNFGVLISVVDGTPFASHLPFVIDPDAGPNGTLVSHMARANPHWRSIGPDTEALAIFQGPHAYVSPTWYDPSINAVPTWNYAVVHAYGVPEWVEDPPAVRTQQEELVDMQEADNPVPWHLDSQPPEYVEGMLKGIVTFRIPIARIEGKLKLSQNHPEVNRRGAIAGLRRTGGDANAAVAV
ncbi:MAG: FMN-binding negative transcriptional regulator [Pseudomonadota bacterium]